MIAYLRPVDYTIAHSLRLLVSITSRCLLPPREKVRLACRERPDSRIAVFGTTECRGKSTSSTRSKRLNMKRETDGAFARYLTLGVFACRGQAASLAISPSAEKHIDRLLRLIAVRAFFVLVLLLLPPSPPSPMVSRRYIFIGIRTFPIGDGVEICARKETSACVAPFKPPTRARTSSYRF